MKFERTNQKPADKEKNMQIRHFNYFDNQHVADSKNAANRVTNQDFDLDIQTVDRAIHNGEGPRLQGGSGFFCEITKESVCTHCCVATVTPCC